ncbi:MAG: matrixin family metalloprotease [Acidobacteria bacterium]|nr:matrixin family metalloprotease [Acidobacteriota bacterium]
MRRLAAAATAAVVVGLVPVTGTAYSLLGRRWNSGTGIVMLLEQGSSGALMDGSAGWDSVSEGALATWNGYLASGVSFRVSRDPSRAPSRLNGTNDVAWADDVYGDDFGSAIAITLSWSQNGVPIESDVLFDRGLDWNAYRGNLVRSSKGGTLYDLRRVALHEFGHVLGLGHPDTSGQVVSAVMNSRVSNTDNLQADDIYGVRALYGGPSTPPAPVNHAPSLTVSCDPCTVEAELTAAVRALASDPDGDTLRYEWSAPAGSFTAPDTPDTIWTAPPDIGSVTLRVAVDDDRGGRASASLDLRVVARDKLQPDRRLREGQSLVSENRLDEVAGLDRHELTD